MPRLRPLASCTRVELESLDTVVVERPTVRPEASVKVVWTVFPEIRLSDLPWSRPEASSKRMELPVDDVEVVARPTVRPEGSVTVLRVVDPLGVLRIVPSVRPEASFMRIDIEVPEAVVEARPVVRPEASWRMLVDGAGGWRLIRRSERRGVGDCPSRWGATRTGSNRRVGSFMKIWVREWTPAGVGYSTERLPEIGVDRDRTAE